MIACLPLTDVATVPDGQDTVLAWRGQQAITRAQFQRRVADWQSALVRVSGDSVALYFEDTAEFAAALYGAWHAGKAVLLPGDAQAETVRQMQHLAGALAGDLPGAIAPPAVLEGTAPDTSNWVPLSLQRTRLVVYTSGSNGEPMAIDKALAQMDAEVQALEACFGRRCPATARIWATVTHQHIYGLLFRVFWPLATGRSSVAQRLVYPEDMARQLGAAWPEPDLLVSSPAHLRRMPPGLDFSQARRALQAIFSSGGPLPPEAAHESRAVLGHSPIEVYGSSETGGIAWRQRAVQGDTWTPLPGVAWRVDGDTLAVRSPHLGDDDWYETADRARREGQGGFVLMGRVDRIVKIEEKRVSLTALERRLTAHAGIQEARVFMLDDDLPATNPSASRAHRPAVAAVLSPSGQERLAAQGKAALVQQLRDDLLAVVDRVALPRQWRFVLALPVNPQGKSTERLLSALFRSDRPTLTWLQRTAKHAQAEMTPQAGLQVFDGHFPDAPILPGVAQLDWAIAWARECFDMPPHFLRLETLKFQQPILPGMRVRMEWHWHAANASLQFEYHSAAGRHASGRVVFGPNPAAE